MTTGEIWSHYNDNGQTSVTKLIFGFDQNQNTPSIDVTSFEVQIHTYVYSIGANTIRIVDHLAPGGSNKAEATFEVDLGFDFFGTYDASSTEEFRVTASVENANAGFDEWFVYSPLTDIPDDPTDPNDPSNPVPEPMTLSLLGMGLLGVGLRKKYSK